MGDDFAAPTPGLAHAFDLRIERGDPVDVGAIATGGRRTMLPVKGGVLQGGGLNGRLAGGSEVLLARADGVTEVEANYYVAFNNGASARAFGKGYVTSGADFAGMQLSLLFEAAEDGPVAELATRAFLAEQPQGSSVLTVSRIV
jgi:hypothetical protein